MRAPSVRFRAVGATLEGRVAAITGASSGIGAATARALTAAGFDDLGFASGDGGRGGEWGVGANRLAVPPAPYEAGIRLFTFVDDLS